MPNPKVICGAFSKHSWSQSSSAETYCLQWHLQSGQKVLMIYDPWANSYIILMVRLATVPYGLHNERAYSVSMENRIKQTHSPSRLVLCLLFNACERSKCNNHSPTDLCWCATEISFSPVTEHHAPLPKALLWEKGWKKKCNFNTLDFYVIHARRRFFNTEVHSQREKSSILRQELASVT